ncbi:MAG: hypothetical protein JXR96_21685 [Deltaproteobacteria bacterium]|nr:hypothetical protein [Deltaproteobacteria bacterium]
MKKIGFLLGVLAASGLISGCIGSAREVDHCDECIHYPDNWRKDEYCVEANDILYCANPCLTNASCGVDFWCVPEEDEGTTWTTDSRRIRWVCMPEEYYQNKKSVWRWDDCTEGGCPEDMTCLYDDTYDPIEYFCSEECDSDSECLSGCCLDTGDAWHCAPYYPYCEDY